MKAGSEKRRMSCNKQLVLTRKSLSEAHSLYLDGWGFYAKGRRQPLLMLPVVVAKRAHNHQRCLPKALHLCLRHDDSQKLSSAIALAVAETLLATDHFHDALITGIGVSGFLTAA